jgi:aspartate/methionine/tyrosine aminotransferase
MARRRRALADRRDQALGLSAARFPADRPLINLSQAVPGYPPALQLRQHLGDAAARSGACTATRRSSSAVAARGVRAHPPRLLPRASRRQKVGITSGCNQAFLPGADEHRQAGDQVILPRPHYFNHDMWMRMQGIEPCRSTSGPARPRAQCRGRSALITAKTRAIVLISPNNPTGAVYPAATIHAFYELAQTHGIACCSTRPTRTSCRGRAAARAVQTIPSGAARWSISTASRRCSRSPAIASAA